MIGTVTERASVVREGVPTLEDRARRALRRGLSNEEPQWHDAYQSLLAEALRHRDLDGVAAVALVAATRLESEGRYEDALASLRYAATMASDLRDAKAVMLSYVAVFEALSNRLQPARTALAAAEQALDDTSATRAQIEFEASSAAISWLRLERVDAQRAARPIADAQREGYHWIASGMMSWLIPYLFARGRAAETAPWNEALWVQARAVPHPWREADALTFAYAREAVNLEGDSHAALERAATSDNRNAAWRLASLLLWASFLRGDWSKVEHELSCLAGLRAHVPPGFSDGDGAFRALVSAYRDDAPPQRLQPPRCATLVNVGAALAGMEAVAVSGRQGDAVAWLRWCDRELPSHVRTAIEWPASTARVRALLLVRTGEIRSATASFRRGISWAERSGYAIEAAIGRVQFAEVLAHADPRARLRRWEAERRQGRETLAQYAIDATPFAYAATRALALTTHSPRERLTRRELEVLTLIAEGMTYKQAGARLGISWRTVRNHATQIYAKLDVSGRMQAVTTAREAEIL